MGTIARAVERLGSITRELITQNKMACSVLCNKV